MDNKAESIKLNAIGSDVIGSAFDVRKIADRYLRENYYKIALAYELRQRGHKVVIEQLLPAIYKGIEIGDSFRMDLVVDDCVVIEVKALPQVGEAEFRQLFTYLKLSNFKLGYLINFGVDNFSIASNHNRLNTNQGIYRFVNNF